MTISTSRTTRTPVSPVSPASAGLVVASVPSGHVYVRHLAPEDGGGPTRLPDPTPAGSRSDEQRWWPPVMLDPGWVATAERIDLMHLHFGFDARSPRDLQDLVDALRRRGVPLLYTVHDLRNPHHDTREAHDRQLDVLVPAADGLVTLTAGAAAEVRRRWGREATVLPHPHVVPFATMTDVARRPRRGPDAFTVGLHLKSLRAGMEPLPVLETLAATVADLDGAVLRVDVHCDVVDASLPRHDAAVTRALERLEAAGRLELHVHDYFTDAELWEYLGSLDVSVLPYRHGTHSGWLEACRDLGTTVVAPSCGYYADQGPVLGYTLDDDGFDAASLHHAVRTAYEERPRLGVDVDERRAQRASIARAHDHLYAALREGR